MTDQLDTLPETHDCQEEGCQDGKHYGLSRLGLCLVCGGCGDGACCTHDDDCFPPKDSGWWAK